MLTENWQFGSFDKPRKFNMILCQWYIILEMRDIALYLFLLPIKDIHECLLTVFTMFYRAY